VFFYFLLLFYYLFRLFQFGIRWSRCRNFFNNWLLLFLLLRFLSSKLLNLFLKHRSCTLILNRGLSRLLILWLRITLNIRFHLLLLYFLFWFNLCWLLIYRWLIRSDLDCIFITTVTSIFPCQSHFLIVFLEMYTFLFLFIFFFICIWGGYISVFMMGLFSFLNFLLFCNISWRLGGVTRIDLFLRLVSLIWDIIVLLIWLIYR
jgi:hypothetical protein